MSDTTFVRNVSAHAREIASGPFVLEVAAGDVAEVPVDIAGRAPVGEDLGEGLLAQPANWEPATAPVEELQADATTPARTRKHRAATAAEEG